jgi:MFS family permease
MFCCGACCDDALNDERQLTGGALVVDDARARKNALVLAVAHGFSGIYAMVLFTLGGLVGHMLADDKSLATLPMATYALGTLAAIVPASLFMRRLGRRSGFALGAYLGLMGAATAVLAIYQQSFPLFCWAMVLSGFYQAFAQYYRYAAADTASAEFRPTAIAWVLAGGVLAAFAGAQVIEFSQNLLAPVFYAGAFLAAAIVAMAAMAIVAFVDVPKLPATAQDFAQMPEARPLREILQKSDLALAVVCGASAHGIMMFAMTAAPIAMIACNHTLDAAAGVIQWHMVAMYAPGFFTGSLVSRFGAEKVIAVGLALLVACGAVAISGMGVMHFTIAMILLGVGWNFAFIGATAMVTASHRPSEVGKVQALNETVVYGGVAVASLLAGKVMAVAGWHGINISLVLFLATAIVAFISITIIRLRPGAVA